MPKYPTFPTLYDSCKIISVTDLKRWAYLKPRQVKSGVLTWSRHGNTTGGISIVANTKETHPYLELNYRNNDIPINYRVQLVTIPSNLGKGKVWYFVCPRSGKRCRKLYMVDRYFYHRSAFTGCMYEKQTYSHGCRKLDKQFSILFAPDKAYEKIYSKHFKKHYNGKPTKRYLSLLKKVETSVNPDNLSKFRW